MDTNSLGNQSNEELKMKKDMTRELRWIALAAVLALSMVGGLNPARALELPKSVCFSLRHDVGAGGTGVGDPSYFDTTVYLAGGPLTFDGWCADVRNSIWAPPANEPPFYYTGDTYRWDDPSVLILGVVRYPENLDLVLYLINQKWPGKLSSGTGELYTGGDVQRAIWALVDDWQGTTYLGPWDETRVQEIVNDARSHGEGFKPKCGQLTGFFLNPIGAGCAPYTPVTQPYQFSFVVVPFECESIPPSCSVPSVAICEGDFAMMQVGVTNGTAPFRYSWTVPAGASDPGDVASFYANVAGVYSVVVTDADGLITSCQGELTVNLKPTALVVNDAKKCADDPTPLILTVTHDPIANPTYLWSPGGETTQSIQVSPATTTTYTVKVTSEAGCSATASGTVTVNPNPSVTVNSEVICEGDTATLTATAQGATSYLWSNGATTPSIQVSPNTTTTYTVTVTSAEGCLATASGTVTVNPKPTVTVDSKEICFGESVTLTATATGATSYRWNNGATTPSIQVSPNSTTTYAVTVTSEAGCTATASGTVTVNPTPTVTVDSKTICAGEPATLTATASAGVTFLWSNGATTPSITVYPAQTTTYTVTVKSAVGCTATASGTVIVSSGFCAPNMFSFSTSSSSATYGTLGNIRTFTTTNGISVKASAFSRTKGTSGTWAKAWLGQYSGGLGVTDNSEGTGGNNTHTVDNTGQDNFVLFEFSQPVVLKRAYLGYVVNDSDLSLWIGTFNDPFNNHLTLDDSVLGSFAYTEENLTTSTSARWADLNAGEVVGNAVVIAALATDTSPEDYFKIALLDICVPSCQALTLACVSAATGQVGVPYTSALVASGGTPPYTFAITAGSLPPGLTLNPATGAITGTPTTAGVYPFTAEAVDSASVATTTTANCGITIVPTGGCTLTIGYYKNHPLAIAPLPINLGAQGGAKTLVVSSQQIGVDVLNQHVYGDPSNAITKLYAQLLAAKLNILRGANSTAVASVIVLADSFLATHDDTSWTSLTATEVQSVATWHAALDDYNNGFTGPGHCDDTEPSPLRLACVSATTGKVGVAYSSALTASGGTPPYSYAIETGSLPPGLTLEPTTGAITGTPTATGIFPFIATVTDSLGATATTGSGGCSITVEAGCLESICGTLLRDCNADGSLASEASLAGWTMTLKDSAGSSVIATTTTDATGGYCFSDLAAGTYQVVVTAKANYAQTVDPDGTKDGKTSVTLASCQNKTGVNFGYTGTAPAVYLVKTGPASAKVGETVTYTFAVTNTGNTCLYGGMSVTDPMFGGTIWHQTPVVPGEGYVFTKTYVVKSTDCTPLVKTATVVGHPPGNLPMVSHSSTWTIAITATAPVPAPTGLKAVAGCAKVTLTWNAVPGATSYKVKRALCVSGPFSVIKSGLTSTTYTDSSLVNGKLYYYVVSAIVGGVESPNCAPVAATPSAGLPSPWQSRDIGKVAAVGSSSYNSGTKKFTVVGSGVDIWNSADEFQYMYQLASGNCSIVAKVESVGNTDPWAKAGVMIRETLTTGSKHASVFVTPDNGVAFQSRASTGGSSVNANTIGLSAPYWVKIVRSGNTFTAYRSSTGSSWTYIGSKTISMASNVYIGVAATSHKDGTLSSAVISNVSATP